MKKRAHERLLKQFAFTPEVKGDLPEGHAIGAASVMGKIDRGGDCIFPGAFDKKVLKDFIDNGFIAVGHSWGGLPIGMPVSAKEIGSELVCEFEYHSTPAAQEARQIAIERTAAGKSVGLSIGFMPEWSSVTYFADGEKMLDFAKANGYDLGFFDTKGIKAWKSGCWAILKITALFEFSQVTVPMNADALLGDVKHWTKSRNNSITAILQAKIHQSFTVAADELALRGYMDVEERIALSSNIGDALKSFAQAIDPQVGTREVSAEDTDWVASKAASEEEVQPTAPAADDTASREVFMRLSHRTLSLSTAALNAGIR